MSPFDLWVTPVSAGAAISHQKTGTPQLLNGATVPYASYLGILLTSTALFHHPILSAPIGFTSDKRPVGIQLHGKIQNDWQLLADCLTLQRYFARPQDRDRQL